MQILSSLSWIHEAILLSNISMITPSNFSILTQCYSGPPTFLQSFAPLLQAYLLFNVISDHSQNPLFTYTFNKCVSITGHFCSFEHYQSSIKTFYFSSIITNRFCATKPRSPLWTKLHLYHFTDFFQNKAGLDSGQFAIYIVFCTRLYIQGHILDITYCIHLVSVLTQVVKFSTVSLAFAIIEKMF